MLNIQEGQERLWTLKCSLKGGEWKERDISIDKSKSTIIWNFSNHDE